MKSNIFILAVFFAVTILSCKNDAKTQEDTNSASEITSTEGKSCKYGIKSSEVVVNWTAYKTNKKVGVKGTFDEVAINAANGTPNLMTLIQATSFKIDTKTVNSNKKERDIKLVTFFFAKMAGDMTITGNVKSVEGDNTRGKGIMGINMNGQTTDTPFEYNVNNNVLTLDAIINTDNWNGQSAIASLNKVCEDKHKGDDGVTKTWPDVAVSVVVPLAVECE